MKVLYLAIVALLGCSNVEPVEAMKSAEKWASDMEFRVKAIHCKPLSCSFHGCRCDLRTEGAVIPLECSRKDCSVILR